MRMTRLVVAISLAAVLGIGCGDRGEKKPVSAKSTPAAAPASATIELTFPPCDCDFSGDAPYDRQL